MSQSGESNEKAWLKNIRAPTTSPNTAACLCGRRWRNTPRKLPYRINLGTVYSNQGHQTHHAQAVPAASPHSPMWACEFWTGNFPVWPKKWVLTRCLALFAIPPVDRQTCEKKRVMGKQRVTENTRERHIKANIAQLKLQVIARQVEWMAKEKNESGVGGRERHPHHSEQPGHSYFVWTVMIWFGLCKHTAHAKRFEEPSFDQSWL